MAPAGFPAGAVLPGRGRGAGFPRESRRGAARRAGGTRGGEKFRFFRAARFFSRGVCGKIVRKMEEKGAKAVERLDKILAAQPGVSRSDAKRLIASGAVTVDGKTERSAKRQVDVERSAVAVNGVLAAFRRNRYLLLNKPLGYVSSTDDPDSPTVLELVPAELRTRGLFPAGRLDKASEGMLVLTDDGAFAHRMLAPKRHVPKTYYVEVDRPVVDEALRAAFAAGVELGGGDRSSPAGLLILSPASAEVTIHEGIYHQVRRMFRRHGAAVTRLVRIRIGALPLDPALPPGGCRELTEEERELLLKTTEPQRKPEAEDGGD